MTKEEIKEAIEELDDEVILAIIFCCKEFVVQGKPLYAWDEQELMNVLDKVLE